jgi:transposase
LARYRKVIKLHQQGSSMHTMAKVLGMGRETVRRFIRSDGFPERALTAARASRLDQFLPFLHQRWAEGCSNARQLWREIKAQGYAGKEAMVRRYMRRLKKRVSGVTTKEALKALGLKGTFKSPPTKRVSWWMLKKADDPKEEEHSFVEQLCRLSPDIKEAKELAISFQKMIKERESAKLGQWVERAEQSNSKEVKGFAGGLKRDKEAVYGALK